MVSSILPFSCFNFLYVFFVFIMFVCYSLFQANTISQVSSDTWMKALYKRQAYQVLDLGIL